MKQYRELVEKIQHLGESKEDRTNTGTTSIFGHQMRFDLSEGFPLVTGKKTNISAIIHELIWFLAGDTNIQFLNENGVHIWDAWANEDGELGPVYGSQWRSWPAIILINEGLPTESYTVTGIDQIANVIKMIKINPTSRRLIVSAWNPAEIEEMALPPCHCLFQFNCRELTRQQRYSIYQFGVDITNPDHKDHPDFHKTKLAPTEEQYDNLGIPKYKLDCQLYQRSCDVFLGVPFNIASYALLTMMIAKVTNTIPGEFIWTGGDCHLYNNHSDQVKEYLKSNIYPLPQMLIHGNQKNIEDFKFEDFELVNYVSGSFIKAPIAV